MNTILVVDLEATCWFPRNTNNGQEQEIIEIGCAYLHLDQNKYLVVAQPSILVLPRYSTVSDFCTELTGHTQARLDKEGVTFEQAIERLRVLGHDIEEMNKPISWASFGDWDCTMLRSQCKRFGVEYPLGTTHFNIKSLLGVFRGQRSSGLRKSLRSMGMEFEGKPHSGVDDAVNAARVLGEMVKRYRMKEIR